MTSELAKTCSDAIGRWGKKDISDQISEIRKQRQATGDQRPGSKGMRETTGGQLP
jgi:hypothetical protein